MNAGQTLTQRAGTIALGCMALFVMGYLGKQHLEAKPNLVINSTSAPMAVEPKVVEAPAEPVVKELVVHVAGAVQKPGVYKLAPGARVQDALAKAGGATKEADTDEINLAAELQDGTQLYVPKKSAEQPAAEVEKVEESYGGASAKQVYSKTPKKPKKTKEPAFTGPVYLNRATKAQLESLPGIGPVMADRILQFRKEKGGFTSIEQLLDVKGIGPKKLAAIRSRVRI